MKLKWFFYFLHTQFSLPANFIFFSFSKSLFVVFIVPDRSALLCFSSSEIFHFYMSLAVLFISSDSLMVLSAYLSIKFNFYCDTYFLDYRRWRRRKVFFSIYLLRRFKRFFFVNWYLTEISRSEVKNWFDCEFDRFCNLFDYEITFFFAMKVNDHWIFNFLKIYKVFEVFFIS